jgi:anti-anti-sigma factor
LDDVVLDAVERFLYRCADAKETQNLVIDLSATTCFGSRFIEVLFRAYHRIKRKGGRIALSGLRGHPAEVIHVSKLQRIWEIYAATDEAVRELNRTADRSGN